ncbi:hypothetical protein BRC75_02915 [Halobacteriales archaeon QH_7_69_31]|nr:MAG: hypothetical protein BRC75_02915 [Halobacteriales archaeon QH_7_69_31]
MLSKCSRASNKSQSGGATFDGSLRGVGSSVGVGVSVGVGSSVAVGVVSLPTPRSLHPARPPDTASPAVWRYRRRRITSVPLCGMVFKEPPCHTQYRQSGDRRTTQPAAPT